MYDDFEAIRQELTELQIKLLGSHVRTTLYARPGAANDNDDTVLVKHELIEPVGGMLHEESFSGGRGVQQAPTTYHATDKGRACFEWYEKQPKS
jgi:hypothetical protein